MALIGVAVCQAGLDEPTEGQTARWEEMLSGLRSEDFAERQRAVAALGDLPFQAIPWVESKLETADAGRDPESRRQLATAMRRLQKRLARAQLESGSPLEIDLEATRPGEVFAAVNALGSLPFCALDPDDIWPAAQVADFKFSGSYWGAVDHLFRVFPPDADLAPEREDLGLEHDVGFMGEPDLVSLGQPHVTTGVLRVRAGRTALEHSNGRDYFVFTLVPKVEPTYVVKKVSLLVKGVELGDGTTLVPEGRMRSFDAGPGYGSSTFRPVPEFTWAIPLETPLDVSRPAKIDGLAELRLQRLSWIDRELPNPNESVGLGGGVRLTVTEKGEDSIRIKIDGKFDQYFDLSRHDGEGMRHLFSFRDADGGEIGFNVFSSGAGDRGNRWHQTFGCRFSKGDPASIRILVPGEMEKIQIPMVLDPVPLPRVGEGE